MSSINSRTTYVTGTCKYSKKSQKSRADNKLHLVPIGPVLFGPEPGIGFSQYIFGTLSALTGAKLIRTGSNFQTIIRQVPGSVLTLLDFQRDHYFLGESPAYFSLSTFSGNSRSPRYMLRPLTLKESSKSLSRILKSIIQHLYTYWVAVYLSLLFGRTFFNVTVWEIYQLCAARVGTAFFDSWSFRVQIVRRTTTYRIGLDWSPG